MIKFVFIENIDKSIIIVISLNNSFKKLISLNSCKYNITLQGLGIINTCHDQLGNDFDTLMCQCLCWYNNQHLDLHYYRHPVYIHLE